MSASSTPGLRPPIIILGNTRSGTTILQRVIAAHPDVVAWYEPRNLWQYADPARAHDEFDESDATERVRRYIRKRFLKYQRKHGDRRVVEKTPVNILRVPYVRAVFPDATYLFVVRDPFSFINSVERKWQRPVSVGGLVRRLESTPMTQLHHYVRKYLAQQYAKKVLRRKYLRVWGPRYRAMDEDLESEDLLTVIARQWAVCSRRAEEELAGFEEGALLRLRYEDFVEDPIAELERICSHCGIELTDEMVLGARQWVKADRQEKWRRFDPRELARLLPELVEEMERHGYQVPPEIERAAAYTDGR